MDVTPRLLNADEVSAWLRIPKSTLYKLCSERRIPAIKVGRHWRFERESIERWLSRLETQAYANARRG